MAIMNRRLFLQTGMAGTLATPLLAALQREQIEDASAVLAKGIASGPLKSAVLHVRKRTTSITRSFGGVADDAMFLLGSISKPICITALMTLFDRGDFQLDDPVKTWIPEFTGDGRERVTIRHLLTHVSGLPDQLSDNDTLRREHAGLPVFVEHAIRTRLQFVPGSKYQYSSMGILLALEVAQRISGIAMLKLVDQTVFQPLGLKHAALGMGRFGMEDLVPCQTEFAAPEAGGGAESARGWDWNSLYWRKLGSPWGGAHASAPDIGRFLDEFLYERGAVVKPATARLMVSNQNPQGLPPRGLGFDTAMAAGPKGSSRTFGHSGSTGTLAWADPRTETICVVLTSLPSRAMNPHPRDEAAGKVAAAVS